MHKNIGNISGAKFFKKDHKEKKGKYKNNVIKFKPSAKLNKK